MSVAPLVERGLDDVGREFVVVLLAECALHVKVVAGSSIVLECQKICVMTKIIHISPIQNQLLTILASCWLRASMMLATGFPPLMVLERCFRFRFFPPLRRPTSTLPTCEQVMVDGFEGFNIKMQLIDKGM